MKKDDVPRKVHALVRFFIKLFDDARREQIDEDCIFALQTLFVLFALFTFII